MKINKNKIFKYPDRVPQNWEWIELGNVCHTTSGGTPSRKNKAYYEGNIPWIKSGELLDGPIIFAEEKISETAINESSAKVFPNGTLLIALYGATVGRLGVLKIDAATNQAVCGIFPPKEIDTKFLFYYLRFVRSEIISKSVGGAQPNISQTIVKSIPIPIAPLQQQKRIVEEIEKQFSRLDEAVENLQRVEAKLKRYKAAVLKAAVEGKLTEEWRKQNPDVEPASKLLERILTERCIKWEEAELTKMKAKGKAPKDDKWKNKYKEPGKPVESVFDTLPNGWCWVTIDQITQYVSSGSRGWAKYYAEDGDLFVRAQNLKYDKLELDELTYVTLPEKVEGQRTLIQKNDILITITGANVTKTALVDKDLPKKAYVNQHVALTRPVLAEMAEYLYWWIVCPSHGRRELEKSAYGAGKPGLNLANIKELVIALPPLAEQQRIVDEISRVGSVVNDLPVFIEKSILRSKKIQQSILQKAFSGELVKSKANDEQAPSLLSPVNELNLQSKIVRADL